MSEQKEAIFVSGMYLDRVHANAPEFIITNQTIHVDKLIAWLQENKKHASDKGYLRVVGKESQNKDEQGNPKRYFQVDTWKPTASADAPVLPVYPAENINPVDIPF